MDWVEPSENLIAESSYLVARGVRPLALVGSCPARSDDMLRAATLIEREEDPRLVPFVIDRGDGTAAIGFGADAWVVDLYRWAISTDIADKQRARILGLLHGYSVEAIRDFECRGCGRLFAQLATAASGSDERASS